MSGKRGKKQVYASRKKRIEKRARNAAADAKRVKAQELAALEQEIQEKKASDAKAIEDARVRKQEELKEFKERMKGFDYDIRVQFAAVAYLEDRNELTYKQVADRHTVGETSLKKKVAALRLQSKKDAQDALLQGSVAVDPAAAGGCACVRPLLSVEAENEAYLTYQAERKSAALLLEAKKQEVAKMKGELGSVRKEKKKVLHFPPPQCSDMTFFRREKKIQPRSNKARES